MGDQGQKLWPGIMDGRVGAAGAGVLRRPAEPGRGRDPVFSRQGEPLQGAHPRWGRYFIFSRCPLSLRRRRLSPWSSNAR